MKKSSKKQLFWYINLAVLMLALGSSDAARGVFAAVFREHFSLTADGLSAIVTISYIGNLVFMLIGSRLSDHFGLYHIFPASMVLMFIAYAVCLLTDSYTFLLVSVFFTMGASTLLNTLMNIMSPEKFSSPGAAINTLFFIQGIGTTFTQSIVGSRISFFRQWHIFDFVILLILCFSILCFFLLNRRESISTTNDGLNGSPTVETHHPAATVDTDSVKSSSDHTGYRGILTAPAFWLFFLMFGFYFVAEHGVMNWMNIYGRDGLGMDAATSALLPSLFYGGITIGRLLFAPFVGRLGTMKSLKVFLTAGTVFYFSSFLIGALWNNKGFFLLLPAGLFLSIIYPTLTMAIRLFFSDQVKTTATGLIMSFGTLFDILFNALFGRSIHVFGYQMSMSILPTALIICLLLFFITSRFKSESVSR